MAIATASIGLDAATYVIDKRGAGHISAIQRLNAEIVLLLQLATIYSMAAMLRDVLQRYFCMLRGLMTAPCPLSQCTSAEQLRSYCSEPAVVHVPPAGCWGLSSKAKTQIDSSEKAPALPNRKRLVHDASSFRAWQDGLEELVPVLTPSDSAADADDSSPRIAAGPASASLATGTAPDSLDSIELLTLADWEWYFQMLRLPPNVPIQKRCPPAQIPVATMLQLLGVGPTNMPAVQARLQLGDISVLKQAALPQFVDHIVEYLDDPGLDLNLRAQHAKTPFLQGSIREILDTGMVTKQATL